MSAFGMQVGCKCEVGARPGAMECIDMWDGEQTEAMVAGRRYVWECLACGHQIIINMKLVFSNDSTSTESDNC